ncbi:MAG: hypothetical protein UX87_C0003G0031 [Candidatus Amesbacteria bacterium GW2011_GWA1_47_16]|uniref:Uncharacterized protein n=3 Tax=Candidatus Amesiibacteriota TaxID=1752730 RepID=A0A0G1V1T9_9BACT|nr:MAG: hypothetical protein UX86_C0015G0030 [Candidatus Amesbacteria bacterium GW2011_GWC1_47_15]KKU64890.1 MAG: hypothetical protein UX87_C0003G0031 [Candidatus Amesbacteria bacterium GW2011_GWA1_47_16]OGD00079.1 MAG: hypothetical protein A2972_01020 [Candidatus Amesbacteria bacterium RIFCSPLOWO2_01_FULL_47_33]OGD00225.1 MAG: hypothetical protein A2701_01505 [Candidatus Amesbacteria bacterium RIFCSPHIGHO2_01_FULL_47_34]
MVEAERSGLKAAADAWRRYKSVVGLNTVLEENLRKLAAELRFDGFSDEEIRESLESEKLIWRKKLDAFNEDIGMFKNVIKISEPEVSPNGLKPGKKKKTKK